MCEMIYL